MQSDWISVSDRLPPEGEVVEVVRPDAAMIRAFFHGGLWHFKPKHSGSYEIAEPSHWRAVEAKSSQPRSNHE